MKEIDDITGLIVDAAYKLHAGLGPGLLESVYEVVLARNLERRGLAVERQKIVTFEYDGMVFEERLRLDLLVESRVIVELKSLEQAAPVHAKQLLTYLRLMNLPVGLLINFGAPTLKEGIQRIANQYKPSPSASPPKPASGLRCQEIPAENRFAGNRATHSKSYRATFSNHFQHVCTQVADELETVEKWMS